MTKIELRIDATLVALTRCTFEQWAAWQARRLVNDMMAAAPVEILFHLMDWSGGAAAWRGCVTVRVRRLSSGALETEQGGTMDESDVVF